MITTSAASETLVGREYVLLLVLADIIDEYKDRREEASAIEAYLDSRIETLEALADELRGVRRRRPPDVNDDEIPL